MTTQRHAILRQIVEVQIPSDRHSRAVQEGVSRLLKSTILPLLERRCDALGRPDTIHRLGRVEVDLGQIPLADLEASLTRAVESALEPRLSEAIHRAEAEAGGAQVTRTASHLELVDYFARTGTLPWWADGSRSNPFSDSVRDLAREAPDELQNWIRDLTRDTSGLRRVVLACADRDLAALLGVLRPADAPVFLGLWDALVGIANSPDLAAPHAVHRLRTGFWEDLLRALGGAVGTATEVTELCRAGLRRAAMGLRLTEAQLIETLHAQRGPTSSPADPAVARVIGTLFKEVAAHPAPESDDLTATVQVLAQSGAPWGGLIEATAPFLQRARGSLRGELREWLAHLPPAGANGDGEPVTPEALRWLRRAIAQGLIPAEVLRQWVARARRSASGEPPALVAAVETVVATTAPEPEEAGVLPRPAEQSRKGFSDADAVYVSNAGLVLLAPFLTSFFTRLGLLEGKEFKGEAARSRAAGLLQHLATEAASPPEHQLPLNKVLCGLPLEAPYEFGPPATEMEQSECVQLLTAVIAQAPVLRDMSLPGFRGTFLLRNGQLSARDGAWLLRVERQTYDVVLDRFPWSVPWVRLPWMSGPMQVEW